MLDDITKNENIEQIRNELLEWKKQLDKLEFYGHKIISNLRNSVYNKNKELEHIKSYASSFKREVQTALDNFKEGI